MIRTWWNERALPRLVDWTLSEPATGKLRRRALEGTGGTVLEVGFGSGSNLRHYPGEVDEVLAVEPADLAWERARKAVEAFPRPVRRIGLDGAALAVEDDSVDVVVSAFTMCTIPELTSALGEMRRVLRPGGRVHFVEHSLHPEPRIARWQQRLRPGWSRLAGGCQLDRDVPRLLEGAGFALEEIDAFALPGPAPMRPFGWITLGRAGLG